jgi:hypothetical protein
LRLLDGQVDVSVVEDDVGRLTAKLERDTLQVVHVRRAHDGHARLGRAREGDLVHLGVLREVGTNSGAAARHNVHHTLREASLDDELGNAQSRQRRLLGRLEHHRVASSEGRA